MMVISDLELHSRSHISDLLVYTIYTHMTCAVIYIYIYFIYVCIRTHLCEAVQKLYHQCGNLLFDAHPQIARDDI